MNTYRRGRITEKKVANCIDDTIIDIKTVKHLNLKENITTNYSVITSYIKSEESMVIERI